MERGEVWLADVDGVQPVVLLGVGEEIEAMQIVPPATTEQRRGFRFVDPDDPGDGNHAVITGIELPIGPAEGLTPAGVVRVALPYEGRIFCTWQVGLTPAHLIERVGALGPEKLRRLGEALRLAGVE